MRINKYLRDQWKLLSPPWKAHLTSHLVGVDINVSSIKLLKMRHPESPYQIEDTVTLPLPKGAIIKNEIKDKSVVVDILKTAFARLKIPSKQIAFSVPRLSVIIKNMTVNQHLRPLEIEERVWFEADHYFPDLIGNLYLDFDVLGPSKEDPALLELLLIACRKDEINPYLDLFQSCDLSPRLVDINCYAFQRALKMIEDPNDSQRTIGLLNLDNSLSSFIVVDHDDLIYAHDQYFDGSHLQHEIQAYLEQRSKNRFEYMDILKNNLSTHILHTMHFFSSSRPHVNIQKLYISGDLALYPQLSSFIQEETGIETMIANPFKKAYDALHTNEESISQGTLFMLSCGLALSQLKG